LDRSWFERLWIWQEIRLANSDAIIMCGHDRILWKDFRTAVTVLRHKARSTINEEAFSERLKLVYDLGDTNTFTPFDILIDQPGRYKCSDERDRIYAILGMLHESECEVGIVVDYSLSTNEVFMNATIQYIQANQQLRLLSSCELLVDTSERTLPTWVP
jgi:hypothetical protein